MDVLEGAVRVLCLCLGGLMLLAAVHKGRVLIRRSADVERLMQVSESRRRHASTWLLLALVVEVAVAVALVLVPVVGLGAALVLLATYSRELRRLAPEESCNCFGNFLRDSRVAAMRRNLTLGVLGFLALVATGAAAVTPAPVSQGTVGAALVVGAFAGSVSVLGRVGRRAGAAAEGRSRQEGGWFAA
jgi:hypothetical protein